MPPPVNMSTITSTSAVITWESPDPPNGVILMYTVNLTAVSLTTETGKKRRKRQNDDTSFCVTLRGALVNSAIDVDGNMTSLALTGLGKLVAGMTASNPSILVLH